MSKFIKSHRKGLGGFASIALVIALALGLAVVLANTGGVSAASGAIWTTTGTCGNPQNINHYEVGQTVFINGSGFSTSTPFTWEIKEPGAGGAAIASGSDSTDENGDLCLEALTLEEQHLGGPYQTQVSLDGAKNDNFSVVEGTQSNGTLTIEKVIENNNEVSPTEFSYVVTAFDDSVVASGSFEADGSNDEPLNLNDGPFTVVENEENGEGYTTSYVGCTDIDLTAEGATCTITNTYESVGPETGTLVVVKEVVSGNATSSDFTLNVLNDQDQQVESDPGSADGVEYTLTVGNYTVTEDSFQGYTSSFASCGTDGAVTVTADQTTTCTVQNRELPAETGTLTLIKLVINDSVGNATTTDWTLSAVGATTSISGVSGSQDVTSQPVEVGDYDLSENGPSGYDSLGWDCGNASMVDSDTVTVGADEDVTCTITNDDEDPNITGMKWGDVNGDGQIGEEQGLEGWQINLYQGSTLLATTSTDSNGDYYFAGLSAGNYIICETPQNGWEQTFPVEDFNCNNGTEGYFRTVVADQTLTGINFGNRMIPEEPGEGVLVVIKEVVNDDQTGTSSPSDFTLEVSGEGTATSTFAGSLSGEILNLIVGTYNVAEVDGPGGYNQDFSQCGEGTMAVTEGAITTCTIVNDDIPREPEEPTDDDSSSGGNGGVINRSGGGSGQVRGESTEVIETEEPEPVVLGETIGLPQTGSGGGATTAENTLILTTLASIAVLAVMRNQITGKEA